MGRRHKREAIAMDLTPLIDIVFLLLIFFLVTSSFKKEQLALLLKLPKSEQGAGTEKKTEQLTIELSDTDIAVNGKKTTIEDLPASFKVEDKTILVNLRIDGDVKYQRLVKVLDLLQINKLENISLITDKENKQ
jgi:biopolymer transport protein ExbD